MQIKVNSLREIDQAAIDFLKAVDGRKKFAFEGEMGAGKTTFINALLKQMGIEDHSSSPTFSIVNEYLSKDYGAIFHFDFYRLNSEEEAYDIGVEDILYEDHYCFMEWPDKIGNLLPPDCVNVSIAVDVNSRIIDVGI
ncbi:tRNA (adenosine(37)-N6)-threonylcarbamoyltransferase complex ATPase subunit type 1 TsaE [Putridiphycobacter roseus]|uniref:tRNA threonylcarbamoyladenosine biosynthesis protein TsaE n=1 Tax=Putridiphycobacter roseus TaxID=2219161 RepID=A0A2W1NMJ1_9FLAO|nr:tRNA (adenosine(37)-N6)-threonylcarbamoyltransferase complex ATPase subunit type 1 TsaE [Putridiphycobacter roseus]PZE16872.1 tRNA (adenosine(37)-N6)-threonylcarbamoyltransferase complex ATPase subunit type 1 TsaE [Putridiphycobacter roseus]